MIDLAPPADLLKPIGQAADRITVEADVLEPLGRARTQVVVHAALDDAAKRITR